MSHHLDLILERLDQYEARLDVTRDQLKRLLAELVDQRIDPLKLNVKQIRARILRGRARPTRGAQLGQLLANNPVPTGPAVSRQEYLASGVRGQQVSVPPLAESRPSVSKTNNKRSRLAKRGKVASSTATKRQRDNQGGDANQEEGNASSHKGNFKVNTLSLNCSVTDCQVTVSTMTDLRKHLKSVHKLDPFHCIVPNCGERFNERYMIFLHDSTGY